MKGILVIFRDYKEQPGKQGIQPICRISLRNQNRFQDILSWCSARACSTNKLLCSWSRSRPSVSSCLVSPTFTCKRNILTTTQTGIFARAQVSSGPNQRNKAIRLDFLVSIVKR